MKPKAKDEYVVKIYDNGKGIQCFYKNGKLHREESSAIIMPNYAYHHFRIEDDNLYRKEIYSEDLPPQEILKEHKFLAVKNLHYAIPFYYLEGIRYGRQEFEQLVSKLQIKDQLDLELLESQVKDKKLKI
jgi:hypothetical protein